LSDGAAAANRHAAVDEFPGPAFEQIAAGRRFAQRIGPITSRALTQQRFITERRSFDAISADHHGANTFLSKAAPSAGLNGIPGTGGDELFGSTLVSRVLPRIVAAARIPFAASPPPSCPQSESESAARYGHFVAGAYLLKRSCSCPTICRTDGRHAAEKGCPPCDIEHIAEASIPPAPRSARRPARSSSTCATNSLRHRLGKHGALARGRTPLVMPRSLRQIARCSSSKKAVQTSLPNQPS